jgi:hypothetical protein
MDYPGGARHPDREIRQSFPVRGRVRGWFFRVEELPSGCWQVKGHDRFGQTVRCLGSNPEDVLNDAESEALVLTGRKVLQTG